MNPAFTVLYGGWGRSFRVLRAVILSPEAIRRRNLSTLAIYPVGISFDAIRRKNLFPRSLQHWDLPSRSLRRGDLCFLALRVDNLPIRALLLVIFLHGLYALGIYRPKRYAVGIYRPERYTVAVFRFAVLHTNLFFEVRRSGDPPVGILRRRHVSLRVLHL